MRTVRPVSTSRSSKTKFEDISKQVGKGTNYGVCSWVSPFFRMPPEGEEQQPRSLVVGALNGENNGLNLLVDAETFDYGNGFYELGQRAGEGFKVDD